jgi:hypothetical protein
MQSTHRLLPLALCAMAILTGVTRSQELKPLQEETNFPAMPAEKAKVALDSLFFAETAQVVAVSDRGAFALSTTGEHAAVFEYGNKGYEAKITFHSSDANFLYFTSTTHQLSVAIRKTGPFDIWFAANGGQFARWVASSRVFPGA